MKKQEKKAISLIVLVITIIVMIILAGTVILALSQNGIIGKAKEAVEVTNLKQVQEAAQVVWADGYIDGLRGDELKNYVIEKLEDLQITEERYNILVNDSGVQITVKDVFEEGDDSEFIEPIKDMEVTCTREPSYDNTQEFIRTEIELFGIPQWRGDYSSSTWTDFSKIFLTWMDWEEALELLGKLLQSDSVLTPEQAYASALEEQLGVSYTEFKNNVNRNDIVAEKTDVSTIEELVYSYISSQLNWNGKVALAKNLLSAYDLLPHLTEKTEAELEAIIRGWYKNEKTINEIIKEVTYDQYETIDEVREGISSNCGITSENAYIISEQQALLYIGRDAYMATHPVIIEYSDGTKEYLGWYIGSTGVEANGYEITSAGTYKIKVTSPTGYVEEEVIVVEDNDAAEAILEIDDSNLGQIEVEVTLKDRVVIKAPIKEYRYYIKESTATDYQLKATTTEATYKFEGLSTNEDVYYIVKVEVEDTAGNISIVTSWDSIVAMVDGVPIPKGFVASPYSGDIASNLPAENTKSGGMVIYELTEDEVERGLTTLPNNETQFYSWTNRNQYVWVPVDKATFETVFKRQEFFSADKISDEEIDERYWEVTPETDVKYTTPEMLAEVQAMYKSVKRYGGFYVARYEAGIDFLAASNTPAQSRENIHSKMGKIPYVNINTTGSNSAQTMSRSIFPNAETNKTGVISTLIYGVQWDVASVWLRDNGKDIYGNRISTITDTSTTTYANLESNTIEEGDLNLEAQYVEFVPNTLRGSFTDVLYSEGRSLLTKDDNTIYLFTTGALKKAQVNNIFDMAGNVSEQTMESYKQGYSTEVSRRSGVYNSLVDRFHTTGRYPNEGFRIALYIK